MMEQDQETDSKQGPKCGRPESKRLFLNDGHHSGYGWEEW